ncbi:MAG: phosphoribosylglycinamide synthetase [Kordiimonas sp.]|nr:phosphoribosylglycinamide synthetase [Kordiimonas sp.]
MHKNCLSLKASAKQRLRILFLAKWAEGDGRPDTQDGTHATYHYDLRCTLENLGLNVEAAGHYERLYTKPDYDFLFTLLNRGGFMNSEMLAPLLATYQNVPFLGASPILRGLGDDKHLMKLAVRARGIQTPDWEVYRRGCLEVAPPSFEWERLVVKPNASSASWGIKSVTDWQDAKDHITYIHDQGHDAIVEDFVYGYELAQAIIGGASGPWFLPTVRMVTSDPLSISSYEQKRHLSGTDDIALELFHDKDIISKLHEDAHKLLPEIWPMDYGRIEAKYNPKTGDFNFIELNLSCNLWHRKSIAFAARSIGVEYPALIETILCHSMLRQGVITKDDLA